MENHALSTKIDFNEDITNINNQNITINFILCYILGGFKNENYERNRKTIKLY